MGEYDEVEVHPPADEKGKVPLLFQLESLMQKLPEVIVQGIPTIERAIVNKVKDKCASGPASQPPGCLGSRH